MLMHPVMAAKVSMIDKEVYEILYKKHKSQCALMLQNLAMFGCLRGYHMKPFLMRGEGTYMIRMRHYFDPV